MEVVVGIHLRGTVPFSHWNHTPGNPAVAWLHRCALSLISAGMGFRQYSSFAYTVAHGPLEPKPHGWRVSAQSNKPATVYVVVVVMVVVVVTVEVVLVDVVMVVVVAVVVVVVVVGTSFSRMVMST